MGLQALSAVSAIIYSERFPYGFLQLVLVVLYFRYFFELIDNLSWPTLLKGATWIAIALPLAALTSGLSAGQTDRREGVATLAVDSARCGNFAVRRKIGDLYIAVAKNEQRLLIDDDCKIKIVFPVRSRFSSEEESAAWFEKRRSLLIDRFTGLFIW